MLFTVSQQTEEFEIANSCLYLQVGILVTISVPNPPILSSGKFIIPKGCDARGLQTYCVNLTRWYYMVVLRLYFAS